MSKQIFITIPSFQIHGGIRVILEWANRLALQHRVYLRPLRALPACHWFKIGPGVMIVHNDQLLSRSDLLIVTSPHAIQWTARPGPVRKVIFLQMLEHLFQPNNKSWQRECARTYTTPYPLITISQWGIRTLRAEFQRKGPIEYVGNGVNLEHFPISRKEKDEKTILVEGWQPTNATKDIGRLGPKAAQFLKQKGYRILAYSGEPLRQPHADIPHEFYQCPSPKLLNQLYERATILIKASRQDFRSYSPLEAMIKGTVTARAILEGDDDLIHNINCLRSGYELAALEENALELLTNKPLRLRLQESAYTYVQLFTWDYWMSKIEAILWK